MLSKQRTPGNKRGWTIEHLLTYLGQRQHRAAIRRRLYTPKLVGPRSLAQRWADVVIPWRLVDYPGRNCAVAQLLGVSEAYAGRLLRGIGGKETPVKHRETLLRDVETRIARLQDVRRELLASIVAADEAAVRAPWSRCGSEPLAAKRARLERVKGR